MDLTGKSSATTRYCFGGKSRTQVQSIHVLVSIMETKSDVFLHRKKTLRDGILSRLDITHAIGVISDLKAVARFHSRYRDWYWFVNCVEKCIEPVKRSASVLTSFHQVSHTKFDLNHEPKPMLQAPKLALGCPLGRERNCQSEVYPIEAAPLPNSTCIRDFHSSETGNIPTYIPLGSLPWIFVSSQVSSVGKTPFCLVISTYRPKPRFITPNRHTTPMFRHLTFLKPPLPPPNRMYQLFQIILHYLIPQRSKRV